MVIKEILMYFFPGDSWQPNLRLSWCAVPLNDPVGCWHIVLTQGHAVLVWRRQLYKVFVSMDRVFHHVLSLVWQESQHCAVCLPRVHFDWHFRWVQCVWCSLARFQFSTPLLVLLCVVSECVSGIKIPNSCILLYKFKNSNSLQTYWGTMQGRPHFEIHDLEPHWLK